MIEASNDMFGGVSCNDMLSYLKVKIKNYQEDNNPIFFDSGNKTRRTVINQINYTEQNGSILLQIAAYGTNLYDGYLETDQRISFKKDHKVGSDTNFVLIHPVIKGLDSSKYVRYFIVLIYEDPTKNNEEIVKITKSVLSKIINIPIANIKLPSLLAELRTFGTIPELQMKYSALHNNENDVDVEFIEYRVGGELKQQKKDNFRNMPMEKVEELWNMPLEPGYQKKEANLTVGKKIYRIKRDLAIEADQILRESAEKVYNASTSITQQELTDVHSIEFIISKLTPILGNYLSTEDEHYAD
jgi:hypothetical protein